jgi:hypothetical protein
MTVAFFSGRARRVGVSLGAVSVGLLALAACDKPTPLATVTVGTTSVSTGAACYNDGNAINTADAAACLNKKPQKTVKVAATDNIHFGVDPTISDHGWTLFINGQQAEPEPFHKTYRTISGNAFFSAGQTGEVPGSVQVSIVETKGQSLVGVWQFELERTS